MGHLWIIAGGSSSNDTLLNDTNVLDLSGEPKWIPMPGVHLPTPKGNAAAATIDGTLYVPGGIERK